jgi:PTS system fructose-specific IIC component
MFELHAHSLLTLAVVLLAGVIGGDLASRFRLPAVTGQILFGFLIGHSGIKVFAPETVDSLRPVTEFALGLIAVTIGDHLNISRLRNAGKRLSALFLTEAVLTPAIVFLAVYYVGGASWILAVLLAAMAVSTAPATVVALVKESRSKGVFVKTLIAAVALNNVACLALFAVAHTAARAGLTPGGDPGALPMILGPLRQLLGAAVLGGLVGFVLVVSTRRVVRPDRLAGATFLAILLVCGVAVSIKVSLLLSCLFLGFVLANMTPEKEELGVQAFENFEDAIFAVFFTLAGMHLQIQYVIPAGFLALTLIVGRVAAKMIAANVAMRVAGATQRVRNYLGLALVPQAGVAVGLILLVQQEAAFESIHNVFLAVGLTTVMVNELIGSLTTHFALKKSGDMGKDRPRLIDFIHEENITTNLKASTKQEAIEKLTDLLIRTHNLKIDRQALLDSILEREKEMSTCLGSGLAIPHGLLEKGNTMVGAMGISREGLDIETPDGIPVHCMVLLATPTSQRDRHLEVLAALARAIGWDRNIQRQLYNAQTPAHAYDLLHAEEAEDFNYFLED